jgi:hypothetical protein
MTIGRNKTLTRLPGLTTFWAVVLLALTIGANGFGQQPTSNDLRLRVVRIAADTDQIAKVQMEQPRSDSVIKVVNRTSADADIDFVAIDANGNEASRETIVVGPNRKVKLNLQKVFPELSLNDLSSIQVQSSVRPAVRNDIKDDIVAQSLQLPVAFFSQRDSRWSGNQLGTCAGTTIGSSGCAISCIAMAGAHVVINCNPASVNTYMTNNGGYSGGCLAIWAQAANMDGAGGFTWIGTGSVSSAANLKSLVDSGKYPIATSSRFSSHFGIIIGYNGLGTSLSDFYYLDPWDTSAVFRTVGDGWVTSSSSTRIYQ